MEGHMEKYLHVDKTLKSFYNIVWSLIKSKDNLKMLGRQLTGVTNTLQTHHNETAVKEIEKQNFLASKKRRKSGEIGVDAQEAGP